MYIHLGEDTVVKLDEVIGIFDMDNTTVSKPTRDFLNFSEKCFLRNQRYAIIKPHHRCKSDRKEENQMENKKHKTMLGRDRAD